MCLQECELGSAVRVFNDVHVHHFPTHVKEVIAEKGVAWTICQSQKKEIWMSAQDMLCVKVGFLAKCIAAVTVAMAVKIARVEHIPPLTHHQSSPIR